MGPKYQRVDRPSSEEGDFDEAVGKDSPNYVTIRINLYHLAAYIVIFLSIWSVTLVLVARGTFNPSELQCAKRVSPWCKSSTSIYFVSSTIQVNNVFRC